MACRFYRGVPVVTAALTKQDLYTVHTTSLLPLS